MESDDQTSIINKGRWESTVTGCLVSESRSLLLQGYFYVSVKHIQIVKKVNIAISLAFIHSPVLHAGYRLLSVLPVSRCHAGNTAMS